MKSSNWKFGTLAAMAVAVAAAGFASHSHAGTISLSISPSSPTTLPGEAVGVDIVVNGLPSASGGFSLQLDYSGLAFTDYSLGGVWGASPDDFSVSDASSVSFQVLADLAITEPDLYVAQNSGGSFVVAHINFTGLAVPGAFTVTLRDWAFSNFSGDDQDPAFNLLLGSNNVPEPMTPLLVAAALGGLALTRKLKTA